MAYIYRKLIHGKPYYYLRISKRIKGKTVVKDVAYLGSDVSEVRKKLDDLPLKYKREIKKSFRNINKTLKSDYYLKKAKTLKLKQNPYISKELLENIEAIKLHFSREFLRLDEITIKEVYKNFLIDFAFNTTSLEGNTITLAEADKLLRENLTPKNRTLREIYDLKNTEKVFFEILKSKKEITQEFIISIHDKLLENIDNRKGYRTHDVRVFKSHFKSSPAVYIRTDMGILLRWFKRNKDRFHPLVLVGVFHQKFEKIHPFADGNGRTGRILMNYILLQNGYPPFIIKKSRRGEYLDCLSKGDKVDLTDAHPEHYNGLISYLAEEMIDSYWNNFLI